MTEPRPSPDALMAEGRRAALEGDWATAAARFRAAWDAAPEDLVARHSLATALLALGRYREGLPLYALRRELRAHFKPAPALSCPEWLGEPLARKHILLFPEQGLGDEIQFARFAPHLARLGAEVTLFCAPPLVRLFQSLGVRAIAAQGVASFPDPDVWAFSLDVPGRLGMAPEEVPAAPYLSAAPRTAPGPRIGIMRRGNPGHANDARRSLPDDLALPFEAVDLSPEATGARDFQDTAERVAGLDAVVSVDTSVAHLAGAMGKPTFLLLPALACDWRWMSGRTDTPWYPSMTLVRQRRDGDWSDALDRVAEAIRGAP